MNRTQTVLACARAVNATCVGTETTQQFITRVNQRVEWALGAHYNEQRICPRTRFTVDFYLPEEQTVIEIERSGGHSHTNLERDIVKVLLAREAGQAIARLIVLGHRGILKRQNAPGPQAIRGWVKGRHDLGVSIMQLEP